MELRFSEHGHLLVATFLCEGEPLGLREGGLGWFDRSEHLDWRCGWQLCVQCGVTVPRENYGFAYLRSKNGTSRFAFKDQANRETPWCCGNLTVENRILTASFPVPDCLDPPKKSFTWGQPILLEEQMFHCQLRLETRGPRDSSHLRRREATRDSSGGIDFVLGDLVMAQTFDSESAHGRGRFERVQKMRVENGIDFRDWIFETGTAKGKKAEFNTYVDNRPSAEFRDGRVEG